VLTDLAPPLETLHVVARPDPLGDGLPVLLAQVHQGRPQPGVLLSGPVRGQWFEIGKVVAVGFSDIMISVPNSLPRRLPCMYPGGQKHKAGTCG
jgi:hypothetical protein